MSEVFYPTLDLFVYQLGEGLGADFENIKDNQKNFISNFSKDEKLKAKVEKALQRNSLAKSSEFTLLLNNPNYYALPNQSVKEFSIEQFYQPAISSDTYGLLFDCSIVPFNQSQSIESFKILKDCAEHTQGNLGKTWLLSGYYSPEIKPKDLEDLALKIFKVIRHQQITEQQIKWEWQQHSSGKFLGGDFFWIRSLYPTQNHSTENRAILIVLYPFSQLNEEFMQTVGNYNQYWLELFSYQNKILWAQE